MHEEKENYMYFGILKAVMKEKIRKEYFRRKRKLLENKLCWRKLTKAIIDYGRQLYFIFSLLWATL